MPTNVACCWWSVSKGIFNIKEKGEENRKDKDLKEERKFPSYRFSFWRRALSLSLSLSNTHNFTSESELFEVDRLLPSRAACEILCQGVSAP